MYLFFIIYIKLFEYYYILFISYWVQFYIFILLIISYCIIIQPRICIFVIWGRGWCRTRVRRARLVSNAFLYTTKIYLGLTTIYDRAYPQKLLTVYLVNPMDVTKPNLLSLFVQPDIKSLEESANPEETYVLTIFGKKSVRIVRSELKLESKPIVVHIA